MLRYLTWKGLADGIQIGCILAMVLFVFFLVAIASMTPVELPPSTP
jgi:hypothetical protein